MPPTPPAVVGDTLADVDTPALIVDLDALEHNMREMAGYAARAGVALRPHAKAHKCAEISLRQMALGAVGVCSQKVSEAEALVDAGVSNVLISNEIIAPPKIERMAALAQRATIMTCVDDASIVPLLDAAAARAGVTLGVLVEVDVGGARCGQLPGTPAAQLARRVAASSHLRFAGLQGYQGRAQHIRAEADRKRAVEASVAALGETIDALRRDGLACDLVTGGGTGTYLFDSASRAYNEIQPGSYVLMDADYGRNAPRPEFRNSLFVYTQVMSATGRGHSVVDAGLKAMSFDEGMPLVADYPGVSYVRVSDEHGNLDADMPLGTKLRLIPGHCDPTVNLYDWCVAVRGERVEGLWPIVARGAIL
ncbi:MAG TPA: DSD1 family PLP-dependent enzyme [Gemmatimonadaceae bacterium]|nr:DSD1 family PLP-dependent enzyme [Gemmatimonadaceae bacterium]